MSNNAHPSPSPGTLSNAKRNLQGATILTAEVISKIAYLTYSSPNGGQMLDGSKASSTWWNLDASGWTQIYLPDTQINVGDHYQGIAFYKNINDKTEVIIANRGSTFDNWGYDFRVSDAQLAFNITPKSDTDALNYYNDVTKWISQNIKGSVNIIETGHSLGGQEADYVNAMVANRDSQAITTYAATTSAVTFDAPGVSKDLVKTNVNYNALNISMASENVHTFGAISILNGGYLGTSVTIKGGVDGIGVGAGIAAAVNAPLGLAAWFLTSFGYNHMTGRLDTYFAISPALGGVDLQTYSPSQVTQGAVDVMADVAASTYDAETVEGLRSKYTNWLAIPQTGVAADSSNLTGETFTGAATPTGFTFTGANGAIITTALSGNKETITDNAGNEIDLIFSADGTSITSATWTDSEGNTAVDNFSADGSAKVTTTYASGSYASTIDDGQGNTTTNYYTKNGNLVEASWVHADGSSGTEALFNNGQTVYGNGKVATSSYETLLNPDGSYEVQNQGQQTFGSSQSFSKDGTAGSISGSKLASTDYDLASSIPSVNDAGPGGRFCCIKHKRQSRPCSISANN